MMNYELKIENEEVSLLRFAGTPGQFLLYAGGTADSTYYCLHHPQRTRHIFYFFILNFLFRSRCLITSLLNRLQYPIVTYIPVFGDIARNNSVFDSTTRFINMQAIVELAIT